MTTLAGLLGAASIIAWVGTVMDIGRALNGESWGTAFGSGILALVLSAAGAVVRSAARSREQRKIATALRDAMEESPALADEFEYLDSPNYQQNFRSSAPHPMPIDVGGSLLFLLTWACMLGGIAIAVIGLLFVHSIGMLVFGIALVLLGTPMHSWQKYRYATNVLRVYEQQMLQAQRAEPPYDLRIALWTTAQALARRGTSQDDRVGHMIEAYVGLVGAWSEDQRSG